jgi:iron(III) transport system substrate-binding protein
MTVASALTALALLAAGLLLGACGTSSDPNTLTIYSGQHEQTTSQLAAAFERETGIKVAIRYGDEESLGNQVLQEGSSSPADVFYSENSPVLESLSEHHLLAAVAPSTLAAVPARYSSASGHWVGVSGRVSELIYNARRVGAASLPSSVLELARPAWRGKVAFAPAETDFQPLVAAVVHVYGEAVAKRWLQGLAANAASYPDNETVATQVNNGQGAIAPLNQYYWYRLRDELGTSSTQSALHYLAPGDVGQVLDVSGAAVLASSDHRAAAQRFLAFLVSEAGQRVLAASHSYEYPLRGGVAAAPGLPPLASLHPSSLTPAQLGDGHAVLVLEQDLGLL